MEVAALLISLASLILVIFVMRNTKKYSETVVRELKGIDEKYEIRERDFNGLTAKMSLIIRMLRQHMKDGEVLVEVGTANDRKLINALQAAGIYVQFDEFPQTELGRSKVIAEMLHGEEA